MHERRVEPHPVTEMVSDHGKLVHSAAFLVVFVKHYLLRLIPGLLRLFCGVKSRIWRCLPACLSEMRGCLVSLGKDCTEADVQGQWIIDIEDYL